MKFRCKISNDGIKLLLSILSSFLKIKDTITLLVSDNFIRFAVISDSIVENPRCFIELSTAILCSDYKIESQHPENTIIIEVSLFLLSKALLSGKTSTFSILKLSKKENKPFLTMECKASESLLSIDLTHDIPINLLRMIDLNLYLPPSVSKPEIGFLLPKGKTFKILIDRLGKLNKVIYLIAQVYQGGRGVGVGGIGATPAAPTGGGWTGNNGNSKYCQLKLKVENNNVKIQSFVNNLLLSNQLADSGNSGSNNNDGENKADAEIEERGRIQGNKGITKDPVVISVHSKKLNLILDYQNIQYHEATLCKTFLCFFLSFLTSDCLRCYFLVFLFLPFSMYVSYDTK
jgi:hypothetical protein